MINILFRLQFFKIYVLVHISSLFHVCKCMVRFPLVYLSLYSSTTPGAIIPVQHSPLGTGWGPQEETRNDRTTKWYQKYDHQPVHPNRTSHYMLNHVILGENVDKTSIKFSNWDVFLKQHALYIPSGVVRCPPRALRMAPSRRSGTEEHRLRWLTKLFTWYNYRMPCLLVQHM